VSSVDRFLLEAAAEEGVSVGREDDQLVVECSEHSEGKIDTGPVNDLAREHDLVVERTLADFEDGDIEVILRIPGGDGSAE